MVRTTERHDKRRRREVQTQTLKDYENTEVEISRKPRGYRYKLMDIMTPV